MLWQIIGEVIKTRMAMFSMLGLTGQKNFLLRFVDKWLKADVWKYFMSNLSNHPYMHLVCLFWFSLLTDNDQDSIFYNLPELDLPSLKNLFIGWRTRYLWLYERELQRSDSNVCGWCQFHYVQVKLSRVSIMELILALHFVTLFTKKPSLDNYL